MTWHPLINVEATPMSELASYDPDSQVGRAITRILSELDDPDGIISAFQSIVE